MRLCCQGPSLAVNTPAKLNLFLEVLGRRPDGYHELETVMVSIGLYDTLLFTGDDSQQTRLRCRLATPPSLSLEQGLSPQQSGTLEGEDNLILRAARLLREQTGCDRGVQIELTKRIPLQAGLGGGSSDAAATLVGLNRFWDLGLTSGQLHEMAARLGSDVNFFLDSPQAALCGGRGERITPLPMQQRLHFVLVRPSVGLSTAEVFARWQPSAQTPRSSAMLAAAIDLGRLGADSGLLFNALEAPACGLSGDIARTLEDLRRAGADGARMSGSGSTCFALCRTARHARTLAGRLHGRAGRCVYSVSTGA
jgi:4-diphosphocytidyl-2-C-methyl-D-erythritol kinase